MATNLPFNARQLYSALRGGKSLSRCPPSLISTSLISTNMLKRHAQSLLFPSSLAVSTIQRAEYTQRAVMTGEETDLSDIPIYVSSILHYTKKPTDHEAIAQARQKIQNEPLHLSKEPKMIGNAAGFDMFREFRAMNKRLDDLNAEVDGLNAQVDGLNAEVKSLKDDKELNGVNELIGRSRFSDLYIDVRKARNEATHGADIKFHRKLLDLPSLDKGKRLACMEGFESTYRLSPAVYDSHFREAPEKIIKIANRRSNLYYLHAYTKSSHHQKEISEMRTVCNDIISVWISEKATTISAELDAKISAFNHLHKLWEEEEY